MGRSRTCDPIILLTFLISALPYVEMSRWFLFNVMCDYFILTAGILHDDLKLFLETNMPKSKKKVLSMLGVADSKIAGAISEEFGFSCLHTDAVPEIIRGDLSLMV